MKRLIGPAVIAVACVIITSCSSSPVLPAVSGSRALISRGCEQFSRHQYEACYAYLVNDSLLARVPYYEMGRQPAFRRLALTRLKSRYYGAARRLIISQTKGWPRHVVAPVPHIRIVGPVRVSADQDTATIRTIETWLVRARPRPGGRPGRVLFAETNVPHTISLERTPTILCLAGHCLHKWVVVRIQ